MDRLVETGAPYIEANAKPVRKLVLEIPMRTTVSGPISNLRPWLNCSICGVRVAEGYIATWRADGPLQGTVAPDGPLTVSLAIPLPAHVLAEVERARAGGDAEILVRGQVAFSHAHDGILPGHALLGETRFLEFGSGVSWKHTIAQSDWVRLLNEFKWNALALVEVPLDLQGRKTALHHLQRANDHLANGNWPEVLGSCYKALEAIVPEAERATVGEGNPALTDKAKEALNTLVHKAKAFCHEGRHHREELPDVGPTEARFAYLLTAGLAQLLP